LEIKVNIGSSHPKGRYLREPWVNFDMIRADKGRFVTAKGEQLPLRDESVTEIHCIHMLEHLSRPQHEAVVQEMSRILIPGGVAMVEVPDFISTCFHIVKFHQMSLEHEDPAYRAGAAEALRCMTLSVYGKGRTPWDYHHWGFSFEGLAALGARYGFSCVRETEMISGHYRQEPVLLIRMTKIG